MRRCAPLRLRAADEGFDGEIVIAAVVDEEYESLGTRALVARGVRADAAIVTEPTRLAIMPAHLGFVWLDVTMHRHARRTAAAGTSASTRFVTPGYFLAELDRFDAEELATRTHPLLGRPSVHASLIEGGTGMSTYPDRCIIRIERRTIPGETPERRRARDARRVQSTSSLAARRSIAADVAVTLSQVPSDVALDAPIVRALDAALRAERTSRSTSRA